MPNHLTISQESSFIANELPTAVSHDDEGKLKSIILEVNWELLSQNVNSGTQTVLKDVIKYKDEEEENLTKSFTIILDKSAPLYIKTLCRDDNDKSPIIKFEVDNDYLTPDENNNMTIPTPIATSAITQGKIIEYECLSENCEDPEKDLLLFRASETIDNNTYISELSIPIFKNPLSDYSPPIITNKSGSDIIITSNDSFTEPNITAKNFMGEFITPELTVATDVNQSNLLYLIYKATDPNYNVSSEKVITVYKQNSAGSGPLITMQPEITHLVPHSSGELVLPKVTSIDYKGNNLEVTKKFEQDTSNLNIWTLTYTSDDDLGNSSSKSIKINAVFPYKLKDMPPIISLKSGEVWPDALTYEKNSNISLPQVKAEDRNGNPIQGSKISCNCNPVEDIENSPNYWVVDYTVTDDYGFKSVKSIKIGTDIAPLLVYLGEQTIEVDTSKDKYSEQGTLLIDKYDVNKIVNAKEVFENNLVLKKINDLIIGNYLLTYNAKNSLGIDSHNILTRTIKLYDGKKDFILLDFSNNNYNDKINGYNYSDNLTQKKNVCEINCSYQKDIIQSVDFSRQIIVHSSEYSVSTSSNNVLRLFTSQDKIPIQFTINVLEDIIGTIDTISFDTNNVNIKYNTDVPFKSRDFNDNITRIYFNIDENTNDTKSFSFTVTKDSADTTVTGFDVLINNIVIKFKDTPVYNILDKNYTDNTRQAVESNEKFIERILSDKNVVNNNVLLNKFIETVNSFDTINNLTKDNLDIVEMSEYTTNNISVLNKTLKTPTNDSFLSIPDENDERNIVWNGNHSLPDSYTDTIVVNNKRIILNKELGNGINLYDVVDSFILGRSSSADETANFTKMITDHVNKNNKNNFYNHVKKFSKNKFTIAPETINDIVTLGENQIFNEVLKDDYPFQSREYLYMSPSEEIITITSDEFKKIKKRDMVIYLGLNDNDQVNFELDNSIIKIKQLSEGNYSINSGDSVLFDDQTFNVDKYRFEMVFSGSLGIQLAGVFKSGIGGDPYIQPLLGPRYKIPYGENSYKYLDNGKEEDRFFINFSTFTLKGNQLSNLNSFVLSTIMKRQNLNNIKETAKMLYSKGLALDTNACFMDKIYIRNSNQEMYFDLEKFRVVDVDNNNTGLPYGFRPIKISNININESIGQHIVINNEKPIATLRIETYHKSYGMIYIDFLKFSHPQIRSAINIQTEVPLNTNNCSGAIISENNILLESLNSSKTSEKLNKQSKIIEEVYIDSNGNYLVNEILE